MRQENSNAKGRRRGIHLPRETKWGEKNELKRKQKNEEEWKKVKGKEIIGTVK